MTVVSFADYYSRSRFGPSPLARLLCPLLTSAARSKPIARLPVRYPGQGHRSPEVSSTTFRAQPPDLQPASLMDMDFAVGSPLVRRRMPPIRFLFIGSRVCSTLPSDPASRRRPCASLPFTSIRLAWGLSPHQSPNMLGTLPNRLDLPAKAGDGLHADEIRARLAPTQHAVLFRPTARDGGGP